MTVRHVQTGARVDVAIPAGDTLAMTLDLTRDGVPVDTSTLTLVAAVWPSATSAVADKTADLAAVGDGSEVTVTGGDGIVAGSYWWTLRDTAGDATVAAGTYRITPQPTT